MEEGSKGYPIPATERQSAKTSRRKLSAALTGMGYYVDIDDDFIGPICESYETKRIIGRIDVGNVIVWNNPKLEAIILSLDLMRPEENQERGG